jgi:hypothetical protein
MTKSEKNMLSTLEALQQEKKYIALKLHPPIGHASIEAENNRAFINEGRAGKFENISESFYDEMVQKFDSRN